MPDHTADPADAKPTDTAATTGTSATHATEPAHRNGGLAVIATLAAHGVDTIFGIPGTHNLELYRHLPAYNIRAITPRHEQGAGYAADGYHLVSGKPGVVITTSGPGLTNAITAAATAYAESRPMLIISPGVPTGQEHADIGTLHETKDASGALDHLLVASHRTRTADGAAHAITAAFTRFASARPGPVHIEIPLDVLEGPWNGSVPTPFAPQAPVIDPNVITRAGEAVQTAARPLIIAGGGARKASTAVARLAERIDAPVVTTANGKGVMAEDHRLSLGANIRFPSIQAESAAADVLIVLGSELADSDLWGGTIGAQPATDSHNNAVPQSTDQTVIRCDIDPDQLHKNLPGDILACADTGDFLAALLTELDSTTGAEGAHPATASPSESDPPETPGTRRTAALRTAGRDATIGARVTRHVQHAAGGNVIIAGDSSQVTYDGTVHALTAHAPDQLLYMPGFATLGYAIPAAIGAKLADPTRPVAAIMGDGAAMFTIQELMNATELQLGIPFIIVDNGGYKEIETEMADRDIPPFAVHLARPDFAALGHAMGGTGTTIDETDLDARLPDALAQALQRDVPTVIHVVI